MIFSILQNNVLLFNFNTTTTLTILIKSHPLFHFSLPCSTPTGVHQVMFVPAIKYLGTDKQNKRWMD